MVELQNRGLEVQQVPLNQDALKLPETRITEATQKAWRSLASERMALYEKDGIVNRYKLYHDEGDFLLPAGAAQIQQLQIALDNFNSVRVAYSEGMKSGDPSLVRLIVAAGVPIADKFIEAVRLFQKWQFDTKQRVETFRKTLHE